MSVFSVKMRFPSVATRAMTAEKRCQSAAAGLALYLVSVGRRGLTFLGAVRANCFAQCILKYFDLMRLAMLDPVLPVQHI